MEKCEMNNPIGILLKPIFENDVFVARYAVKNPIITLERINDVIKNRKNPFYSEYLAVKDYMFQRGDISHPGLLKIVGGDRVSTQKADRMNNLMGTIYTHSVSTENAVTDLKGMLHEIKDTLNVNPNTTRLVVRNAPQLKIYKESLNIDSGIDVQCATQFQFLKHRFLVNFRAHAIKSEFISDFCLIYKYFFAPVYLTAGSNFYEILANTTQEIEHLDSEEIKKFTEFICVA